MVYALHYRRPSHVSSSGGSVSGDEKQRSINESITSGSSRMSNGIPEALSFDKIISGGTCPPVTIRDFMNYLKYIEFSAENLQFYLWFQDYAQRFDKLPASEKALSSPWTQAKAEAEAHGTGNGPTTKTTKINYSADAAEAMKNTDFDNAKPKGMSDSGDPFTTPTKTSSMEERRDFMSEYGSSMGDEKTLATSDAYRSVADNAFEDAGMKWSPFTMQPYRDEVNRIISVYIAERSPREINMSGRERAAVLHALQNTTHPSAFRILVTSVEYSLRHQAHPNFVRWTICNGNRPRVIFARGLGIAGIVGGLVADLLITLSHASRPWRVIPFIGWFIGISTLIAAWKGMCVVLHGMHHRHIRPWELFAEDTDEVMNEKTTSRESFLSQSTNSFEDEPWIARYKKRNVIRKIFDRETWIEEPALRQIQDTIFVQAILGAFVLSAIFVGIFCAVPRGNFY